MFTIPGWRCISIRTLPVDRGEKCWKQDGSQPQGMLGRCSISSPRGVCLGPHGLRYPTPNYTLHPFSCWDTLKRTTRLFSNSTRPEGIVTTPCGLMWAFLGLKIQECAVLLHGLYALKDIYRTLPLKCRHLVTPPPNATALCVPTHKQNPSLPEGPFTWSSPGEVPEGWLSPEFHIPLSKQTGGPPGDTAPIHTSKGRASNEEFRTCPWKDLASKQFHNLLVF